MPTKHCLFEVFAQNCAQLPRLVGLVTPSRRFDDVKEKRRRKKLPESALAAANIVGVSHAPSVAYGPLRLGRRQLQELWPQSHPSSVSLLPLPTSGIKNKFTEFLLI
jgi:hypothetical protein